MGEIMLISVIYRHQHDGTSNPCRLDNKTFTAFNRRWLPSRGDWWRKYKQYQVLASPQRMKQYQEIMHWCLRK